MKYLKFLTFSLIAAFVFTSCDDDDFTGDSSLVPSTASITINDAPASPNFVEQDTTFTFTVSIDPVQVVDVPVYISQSGGDATLGSDFTIDNNNSRAVIPAYSTSANITISVLGDTEPEGTESFTIKVGDERTDNASVSPVEITFTIGNDASDDLAIDMSWATASVFDATGAELAATDVGDLILYVLAADTVYASADGAAFESLTMSGGAPNGTYEVAVGIWGFIDLGDVDAGPYSFDVSVGTTQDGVGSSSLSYVGALSTDNCLADYRVIGQIEKSGTSYVLSEASEAFFSLDNPQGLIGGSYTEVHDDGNPQSSAVTISSPDANGLFTITNFGFSSAWWCGSADATLDLVVTDGVISFPAGGAGSTQVPGNLAAICGYDGPEMTLNSLGTWDPCSGVIEFNIAVRVALGTFSSSSTMTYTPN